VFQFEKPQLAENKAIVICETRKACNLPENQFVFPSRRRKLSFSTDPAIYSCGRHAIHNELEQLKAKIWEKRETKASMKTNDACFF
jgi:hypothetical protein